MSNLNSDILLKALDNDKNESIIKLNHEKLQTMKNNILQKLQLDKEKLKLFHKKLKNYRYIDEMADLQFGHYIRWIKLTNPTNINLTNGGIICDILVFENGVHIKCKNNMNRLFQVIMEENLIFQKLSDQEQVILSVMDFLDKN